jgi:ABC-type transport system substrate-binding protein
VTVTGALARHYTSRAKLGSWLKQVRPDVRNALLVVTLLVLTMIVSVTGTAIRAVAETRPHYGGTLHVMLQSAPNALALPADAAPSDYWDAARALSLVGDTLVRIDTIGRAQPALALAWQSDPSARHWQFTLRHGVKFHDGSVASPEAIAQILGAGHPSWNVRPSVDSVLIDIDATTPYLLAELALPRNLLLKPNGSGFPVGTGAFLVAEWQPGKSLKLAANEDSWTGRPFVDAVQIEFGKSLRDQAVTLDLDKTDVIEVAPQASGLQRRNTSVSLPVELMALVFPANSKAQDPRLRQALALAIDRKPIQSVLLKGAGEASATILPNWMTGYSTVFSATSNPQRARAVLAGSRQPVVNLSYDPRDAQAQLIAERIALNAREVGIMLQVSLSGAEDIRLVRVALPSPDPATSLAEAVRELGLPQLGLPQSALSTAQRGSTLEDLYQAERGLLDQYAVIPLFHLPLASTSGGLVRGWQPDPLGQWSEPGRSLADAWLSDSRSSDARSSDARIDSPAGAGPR